MKRGGQRLVVAVGTVVLLLGGAAGASAQTAAVYVSNDAVSNALAKGGVLIAGSDVRVYGERREKAGPLETQQNATTIVYVIDGGGVITAGTRTQQLAKGDLIVIPAGMTQSFASVSPAISYYMVTVPVRATGAAGEFVYVPQGRGDAQKGWTARRRPEPSRVRRLSDGPIRTRRLPAGR